MVNLSNKITLKMKDILVILKSYEDNSILNIIEKTLNIYL